MKKWRHLISCQFRIWARFAKVEASHLRNPEFIFHKNVSPLETKIVFLLENSSKIQTFFRNIEKFFSTDSKTEASPLQRPSKTCPAISSRRVHYRSLNIRVKRQKFKKFRGFVEFSLFLGVFKKRNFFTEQAFWGLSTCQLECSEANQCKSLLKNDSCRTYFHCQARRSTI